MNPSGKYFSLPMILVLLLPTVVCSEASLWPTVHVSIENDIGADLALHFSLGRMLFIGLRFTIIREIQIVVVVIVTGK
ncbi:hypothetical protein Dsin_015073 [Dipteronia sinensis]|uniref:Uncharacterized protein n=1 Tax=Dipteronia sinensis TaxID=43782 RepID=A0AAE0ANK9_9ROSI|nr:hypothetical protein Dsin_015073 [Dipteronia sinensis]